jgi:hypothetical protein
MWAADAVRRLMLRAERRGAVSNTKEEIMSSKSTVARLAALGLVVAACAAAPALAITDPPASTGTPPAASYYTPEALNAQALRWTAMARFYSPESRPDITAHTAPATVLAPGTGFDWADAVIGAATGFLLAAGAAVGITVVRREKHAI